MASVASGLLFVVGAIFCWGTAPIFLKLQCVASRKIPGEVMALYFSFGYLLASRVGAGLLLASGHTVRFSASGLLGGLLWGVGKVLHIFAVTSSLGLATAQAIVCGSNVLANFMANAITRREVIWEQIVGVGLILLGLVTLTLPHMGVSEPPSRNEENIEVAGRTDDEDDVHVAVDKSGMRKKMIGVALATGSGIFMGVQAVPFQLSGGSDPLEYAINEGIGQFLVIFLSCGGVVFWRKKGKSQFSWREGVPAGLAGGLLLFAAAAFNTKAVAEMGLIAGCLGQLNMVVAGLWGILLFREMSGSFAIAAFSLGVAFAFMGAVLVTANK